MLPRERHEIKARYLELRLNNALQRIKQFKTRIAILKGRKTCSDGHLEIHSPTHGHILFKMVYNKQTIFAGLMETQTALLRQAHFFQRELEKERTKVAQLRAQSCRT